MRSKISNPLKSPFCGRKSKMRIAIDASSASEKKRTGVENVAYQIILNLKKIDNKNDYLLYTNRKLPKELVGNNFSEVYIPFPRLWHKFRLPMALYKHKPDALIVLGNEVPSFAPKNTIVYIHDLAYKYFPKAYSKSDILLQERAIKKDISHGAKIVFVSQATQKDFNKFHHYDKNKMKVIYNGFDKTISGKKQLHDGDFLFVGRIEERKNILNLVKAYELFRKESDIPKKLLLIGRKGIRHDRIIKQIKQMSNYGKDIILKGYVSDTLLSQYYGKSCALVYPSSYEGFGMPILEAFANNLPVITSNISSMPEISKDAAILIDPMNPAEIAGAMNKVLTDNELRNKLIKYGRDRLKDFDWQKSSKELLEFIKEGEK